MAVKPIPEGYHSVTPYLIVEGVERLIEFLKRAFDAKEILRTTGGAGGIHAEVRIGDSVVMMGDAGRGFAAMPASIYLYLNDVDTAYQRALQAGASSLEEPADQPYGDRRAGVKDSCGNIWWIATHIKDT
jgi:PhnB protein